jgi:hypothetical protein
MGSPRMDGRSNAEGRHDFDTPGCDPLLDQENPGKGRLIVTDCECNWDSMDLKSVSCLELGQPEPLRQEEYQHRLTENIVPNTLPPLPIQAIPNYRYQHSKTSY